MTKNHDFEEVFPAHMPAKSRDEWRADCDRWRGRMLSGEKAHWCYDWDGLPVDETCGEWPCTCWPDEEVK